MSLINSRPDPVFAQALEKVSPENQAKTKAKAQDFEAEIGRASCRERVCSTV